jgi:hypothetical protein
VEAISRKRKDNTTLKFSAGDVIEFSDLIYDKERKIKVTVLKTNPEYHCNFETYNLFGEKSEWVIDVSGITLTEWKNRGRKENP